LLFFGNPPRESHFETNFRVTKKPETSVVSNRNTG
jgi:hypothetical protein